MILFRVIAHREELIQGLNRPNVYASADAEPIGMVRLSGGTVEAFASLRIQELAVMIQANQPESFANSFRDVQSVSEFVGCEIGHFAPMRYYKEPIL
jgi:hypothetical protein